MSNSDYRRPTLSGRITSISETQSSASGFSWRVAVIETGGKYANPIATRWLRDNTALLDKIKVGDNVTIQYRIDGREYNGKYYTDIVGLSIVPPAAEPTTAEVEEAFFGDGTDDQPF